MNWIFSAPTPWTPAMMPPNSNAKSMISLFTASRADVASGLPLS
jgi:hypothetical protein